MYDLGLQSSRYVDDLLFASTKPIGKRRRAVVRNRISDAGFTVNNTKTRVHDLRRGPVEISGVGVRLSKDGLRTFMPRPQLRRLHGLLRRDAKRQPYNPGELNGLIGHFLACTPRGKYNASEQRVVDAYEAFCRRHRRPSRIRNPRRGTIRRSDWSQYVEELCVGWRPAPTGVDLRGVF